MKKGKNSYHHSLVTVRKPSPGKSTIPTTVPINCRGSGTQVPQGRRGLWGRRVPRGAQGPSGMSGPSGNAGSFGQVGHFGGASVLWQQSSGTPGPLARCPADTGHILTMQSNQFCPVQEAECAVQDATLCSPE